MYHKQHRQKYKYVYDITLYYNNVPYRYNLGYKVHVTDRYIWRDILYRYICHIYIDIYLYI